MTNVTIVESEYTISLVDENQVVLFAAEDWEEVESFANKKDLNILYSPKDLVFEVGDDPDMGPYVFFDVKYGEGGHDNLGGHNVRNLPYYVERSEVTECYFSYDSSISQEQVIKDLKSKGAVEM